MKEIQQSFTSFSAFSRSLSLMAMSLFNEAIYKEPNAIDDSSLFRSHNMPLLTLRWQHSMMVTFGDQG